MDLSLIPGLLTANSVIFLEGTQCAILWERQTRMMGRVGTVGLWLLWWRGPWPGVRGPPSLNSGLCLSPHRPPLRCVVLSVSSTSFRKAASTSSSPSPPASQAVHLMTVPPEYLRTHTCLPIAPPAWGGPPSPLLWMEPVVTFPPTSPVHLCPLQSSPPWGRDASRPPQWAPGALRGELQTLPAALRGAPLPAPLLIWSRCPLLCSLQPQFQSSGSPPGPHRARSSGMLLSRFFPSSSTELLGVNSVILPLFLKSTAYI